MVFASISNKYQGVNKTTNEKRFAQSEFHLKLR